MLTEEKLTRLIEATDACPIASEISWEGLAALIREVAANLDFSPAEIDEAVKLYRPEP